MKRSSISQRKKSEFMTSEISITIEDLRDAVRRNADLSAGEQILQRRLKLPAARRSSASALYALGQVSPDIAELVTSWMAGGYPAGTKPGRPRSAVCVPFTPRGIRAHGYVKSLIKKESPSCIAVDASPAETGAALLYACSMVYGLKMPASASLVKDDYVQEEMTFHPGDFLPELAVFCFQNRIPLVPLSTPQRMVPSEHQFNYHQMLATVYAEFAGADLSKMSLPNLEKRAASLMQQVFGSGMHLVMEREDLIAQSCYCAGRLLDLARFLTAKRHRAGPVLLLYKMKHALDLPSLVQTFWNSPVALAELYSQPEPQPDGSFTLRCLAADSQPEIAPTPSRHADRIEAALESLLQARRNEGLSLDDIDRLTARTAEALRCHPRVERPPGVRGSLAAREIAQAFGLMHGGTTRDMLARALWTAMKHRTRLVHSEDVCHADIFKSILGRLLYDISLHPADAEKKPGERRPLSPDELCKALQGLSEAALRSLDPNDGVPIDDPAFAEEAMKHPLVQQALQDAAERGALGDIQQAYRDMLSELEDRGMLDQIDSSHMTLSQDGRSRIQERLEEMLSNGEISPEELADALNKSMTMPAPPGLDGEKVKLPAQKESELLAEMMDFQHQAKSESSSLEDLYIHYTLDEKKGLKVSKEKLDYEKLKVMVHQLEKQGLVSVAGSKKRFTITHRSLNRLLETLVRRHESQVLEKQAFKREHETDKTEVRRYRRGDVFSDISLRHTLRRILRKGKTPDDINYTDLRAFEKKPQNHLDIVVCVDISASMKEGGKLRFAKLALGELAKAAVDKKDRMGIIAFSNVGEEVVPLTDKITPLLNAAMTMRADQYTNIGNGLHRARRMLLKEKNSNMKYIILITDGQPNAALSADREEEGFHRQVASFSRETTMETKIAMGTHHALTEAAKTGRSHIKISVVYISPEGEEDEKSEQTAREIARIGGGRFHRVRAIERLPLEALETVV